MDKNKFLKLIVFVFCCVSIPDASAYNSSYLPFNSSSLGQKFPLTCVVRDILETKKFKACGVEGQNYDYDSLLKIQNADKQGSHWKLAVFSGQGGSIWKADLDHNGQPDLIIFLWSGGKGISPTSKLFFLMFNKNSRPNIFSITGYFQDSDDGIEDIRQLPQQKNATLVEQILASDIPAEKNYWRTTLWQAESEKWTSLKQFSNLSLPTYTLFTNKANHRVTKLRRTPEINEGNEATIQLINPNGKELDPIAGEKFIITK